MRFNVKLSNSLDVQFDSDTVKDGFTQLSLLQEVFGEGYCGKCKSDELKFVVRENEGNEYHELRCMKCSAKLLFGANKKGGGLFPKRKDGDKWLPDRGWVKWNPQTKQQE